MDNKEKLGKVIRKMGGKGWTIVVPQLLEYEFTEILEEAITEKNPYGADIVAGVPNITILVSQSLGDKSWFIINDRGKIKVQKIGGG